MAKKSRVERPTKSAEFEIVFATREAERGWRDLRATQRKVLTDAWDALARDPRDHTPSMYPLRGELGLVSVAELIEVTTRWCGSEARGPTDRARCTCVRASHPASLNLDTSSFPPRARSSRMRGAHGAGL